MQDGEKHRRLGIFRQAHVLAVFDNADHPDARSIPHPVIPAHRVGYGAEDFARKLLVDHCHARRIGIVMPGDGPSGQQGCARRMEVFGRYLEHEGSGRGIQWAQIGGFVGEDHRGGPALIQRRGTGHCDGLDTRNRLHGIDHAPLHGGYGVPGVTGHFQDGIRQHGIARLKSDIAVQRLTPVR